MKMCSKCKQTKTLNEFHRASNTVTGRQAYCKACVSEHWKQRYASDPERYKMKTRAWSKANPEIRRANRLQRDYSITTADYEKLLTEQQGRCAICGSKEPNGRGRLHIDHDHRCCLSGRSCGKCIRGLLCNLCNTGLGYFKEDPALMAKAANYLGKLMI